MSRTSGSRLAETANASRIFIPVGVGLERPVGDVADLGEGEDLLQPGPGLRFRETLRAGGEDRVLASRELGVEAGAELEEGPDPAPGADGPPGGPEEAREEQEQGALPRPVGADHAQGLARREGDRDVDEGGEALVTIGPPGCRELQEPIAGPAVEAVDLGQVLDLDPARLEVRGDGRHRTSG